MGAQEITKPETHKVVYLMDDMPILSQMYRDFFARHGYETQVGTNADATYARLHDGQPPPDVLVLDVNVHGSMNGLDLCRRLRAEPRYRRIPIIVLTANPLTEADAWAAGCDAFFTKPCLLDALVEAIDALTRV